MWINLLWKESLCPDGNTCVVMPPSRILEHSRLFILLMICHLSGHRCPLHGHASLP